VFVHAHVKADWQPEEGERLEDDLLIRPDKNPNTAKARELFAMGEPDYGDDTDLVLVWGEGYDFARLPRQARVVFLNSYLAPENGHADVFLPLSIQTERAGHYTNCQGVVSRFEPCFPKGAAVLDAEALFTALAPPPQGHE
jgi:NADH-quinone oxidoreductase subunit G